MLIGAPLLGFRVVPSGVGSRSLLGRSRLRFPVEGTWCSLLVFVSQGLFDVHELLWCEDALHLSLCLVDLALDNGVSPVELLHPLVGEVPFAATDNGHPTGLERFIARGGWAAPEVGLGWELPIIEASSDLVNGGSQVLVGSPVGYQRNWPYVDPCQRSF